MPSFLDGNGAVVVELAEQNSGTELVITFYGPLYASPTNPAQSPTNIANYSIEVPTSNPQMVSSSLSSVTINSASYNPATNQVTLDLATALLQGQTYRVLINGVSTLSNPAAPGLIDANQNQFDGDYDDTATGNFYAVFAWAEAGTSINYTDSNGAAVSFSLAGPGQLNTWRALNGDFNAADITAQSGLTGNLVTDQMFVANGDADSTTLTGSATFEPGSIQSVIVPPTIPGEYVDALPNYFKTATPAVPASVPHVATANNLPYTIRIEPVNFPGLPELQSPVTAQDLTPGPYQGYWLLFGGRTNGLHTFNPSNNFPPEDENQAIYVVNPATGQVWSKAWSDTNVSVDLLPPLYSTNQQSHQDGDNLYTIGGYGAEALGGDTFADYVTYDTLTAMSVHGMIDAIINDGDIAAGSQIQQIQDSRFKVTGGELEMLGDLSFLVLGHDFEGQYNPGSSSGFSQTYTSAIHSFQINYDGDVPGSLNVTDFQTQIDQTNFRRRDYNLGSVTLPDGTPALEIFGGVFTPGPFTLASSNSGFRNPILITGVGETHVVPFQQSFSQYSSPHIGLYSETNGSMNTIFLGGITLFDVNFATGDLAMPWINFPPAFPGLPFTNNVTAHVTNADGTTQELEMPNQLPGFYGANARFFQNAGLTQSENGVLDLDQLLAQGPTVLGYMYGGIESTVGMTSNPATQTKSSNAMFKITLVPNVHPASNATFVNSLSQVLLGREADPDLEAKWVRKLDRGMSRERVAKAFIKMPEHRTRELQGFFNQFLNSTLDAASEKFYLKKYARGASDQQVIAMILKSPAFREAAGATSPSDNDRLVVALYTDLFNRPPTSEEDTYWNDRLDSGTRLATMIDCLLMSPEYKEDLVENYFTIYLGRSPSEGEEADWVKSLDRVSSERLLTHLLSTQEYFENHPGAS